MVVEGLSRAIHVERRRRNIQGISFSGHAQLTHLLFIDDKLLFCLNSLQEGRHYKNVIDLFFQSISMKINVGK